MSLGRHSILDSVFPQLGCGTVKYVVVGYDAMLLYSKGFLHPRMRLCQATQKNIFLTALHDNNGSFCLSFDIRSNNSFSSNNSFIPVPVQPVARATRCLCRLLPHTESPSQLPTHFSLASCLAWPSPWQRLPLLKPKLLSGFSLVYVSLFTCPCVPPPLPPLPPVIALVNSG